MAFKRVKNTEHTVNTDTGEVITVQKEYTIGTTTEAFFLVFLASLQSLYELKSATDIKLLAYLCSTCQFNTNIVHLPKAVRKEICTRLDITNQTLSNSLGALKKLGLLSGDGGSFTINPDVMWKGSIKERDKWMKGEGLDMVIKFRDLTKENQTNQTNQDG
jgi:hypothetical protein